MSDVLKQVEEALEMALTCPIRHHEIVNALATLRGYKEWSPIETAPSGIPILGRGTFTHPPLNGHIKDIHHVEMTWSDFWRTWSDPNGHAFTPTGWQYLPAQPKTGGPA